MNVRVPKTVYYALWLFFIPSVSAKVCRAQDAASPGAGASPAVKLYSPYTEISVPPGQTINYSIDVINNSDAIQNTAVSVSGLPRGWDYTLKSGGWNISRISVLPRKKESLSLEVTVPLKVNKGTYRFHVNADGGRSLPLLVHVSQKGTYKTEFTAKQPNLEGAANSKFTFNATLKNATADTQLYALNARVPPGWNVTFKASYKQVASVSIGAGQSSNITIDVDPPDETPAGTYKIPVLASTGSSSAGFELEVVVTGSYDLSLGTPSGRLSADITAGDEKRIALAVENTGSAPLKNVSLTYAAPADWDVTFDPEKIAVLPAGKTAPVYATIKASKEAIAGDYVTKLEAKTPETSSEAAFRISVRTPVLWGWVGVLIICLALGSVYYLFRKYGRR